MNEAVTQSKRSARAAAWVSDGRVRPKTANTSSHSVCLRNARLCDECSASSASKQASNVRANTAQETLHKQTPRKQTLRKQTLRKQTLRKQTLRKQTLRKQILRKSQQRTGSCNVYLCNRACYAQLVRAKAHPGYAGKEQYNIRCTESDNEVINASRWCSTSYLYNQECKEGCK